MIKYVYNVYTMSYNTSKKIRLENVPRKIKLRRIDQPQAHPALVWVEFKKHWSCSSPAAWDVRRHRKWVEIHDKIPDLQFWAHQGCGLPWQTALLRGRSRATRVKELDCKGSDG